MNSKDVTSLCSPEAVEMIEGHLDHSPTDFALKFHGSALPVALIASQIELLQRAKAKLPAWYTARCLLTRRAFEQASSEAAQRGRPLAGGGRAADLTGGLGVDAWHLSQAYDQVDYLEVDAVLCQMAEANFQRLGAKKIAIHHAKAEEFSEILGKNAPYNLIFIDPDRRNSKGERVAAFEDCQPSVLALLPELLKCLAPDGEVLIKASPMLDLTEGRRQLKTIAPWVQSEVISVRNEVKEALFRIKHTPSNQENDEAIRCHMLRKKPQSFTGIPNAPLPNSPNTHKKYIYEADVALYKSNLVPAFFNSLPDLPGTMVHSAGYFFSDQENLNLPAKVYRILAEWPYKPKQVKRELRSRGIKKVEVSRRHFNLPTKAVSTQLGLQPGGEHILLCSLNDSGKRWVWLCERVQ